jgi:hypothetical protein
MKIKQITDKKRNVIYNYIDLSDDINYISLNN